MKLIIGGCAQGKRDWALQQECAKAENVFDQMLPEEADETALVIVDHLHLWIRKRLLEGTDPEEEILGFVRQHPDCILISDEVGNGIVPVDPFEREYRERTGRILVKLAQRAETVERIFCGIAQRIK